MSSVVTWLLTNVSGDELRMPVTDLARVMTKVNSAGDISNASQIAQGGVIKREYLTHDIMTILGIYDNNHIPDPAQYERLSRYFNSDDGKLYILGSNGWTQPVEPDIERMFVSMADGKLYRYFNGSMVEVGGGQGELTAEDI